MGIIANPSRDDFQVKEVSPNKTFADTKRFISQQFYQALNRHFTTDNGNYVTYLQQMVQNTIDMAVNPEKDDYVKLAATKFIVEHLEGKAGVMTDERHEEMPKLVICVNDTTNEEIKKNITELEGATPKEDIIVEISDKDGSNKEEYIV